MLNRATPMPILTRATLMSMLTRATLVSMLTQSMLDKNCIQINVFATFFVVTYILIIDTKILLVCSTA